MRIRRRVLDDAAPAATLSRTYGDVVFPIDEPTRRARDVAGLRNVARRLSELLAGTDVVPPKLASEVRESLSKLLAAIADKSDEAA